MSLVMPGRARQVGEDARRAVRRTREAGVLSGRLTKDEERVEDRLRTLALCVCAGAVMGAALWFLKSVLVPFVLAVAMRYLLQPLVRVLTVRPFECAPGVRLCTEPPCSPSRPAWLRALGALACHLQLPHWLAVFVTLAIAFGALGALGLIIADSVRLFATRADAYADQVRRLCAGVLGWLDAAARTPAPPSALPHADEINPIREVSKRLTEIASRLPLSQLILAAVEAVLALFSNLFLVLLFTIYLLLGRDESEPAPPSSASAPDSELSPLSAACDDDDEGYAEAESRIGSQVDDQIKAFIKGKVLLSLLVGGLSGLILFTLHVDLWLVFGALAFWLNFVPNIGAVVATLLPMPIVCFDPHFTHLDAALTCAEMRAQMRAETVIVRPPNPTGSCCRCPCTRSSPTSSSRSYLAGRWRCTQSSSFSH